MARPLKEGLDYYISALMCDIEKDLNNNPKLEEKLGYFKSKFIKWCAEQRLIFKADISDEVTEFKTIYIKTRLYNIDINLWSDIRKEIFERDNYTCNYCNQVGGILEVDHIIPVSKGGNNEFNNLTTSCRSCNRKKRDKLVDEFINGRE